MKRELGIIRSTQLGIEDHGIMTFFLHFDFGGTCQGFGGYTLDDRPEKREVGSHRRGTAFGCEVIRRILEAVGVDNWEELVGNEMWVIREDDKHNAMIRGIEAPKYRKRAGRPFNIQKLAEQFKKKEASG